MGPSWFFRLPVNSLTLIKLGLLLAGSGNSLLISYSLGWAISSAEAHFSENDQEEATEKILMITSLEHAAATALMPLISSLVYRKLGFEKQMDLMGFLLSIFALVTIIYAITWRKPP